MREVKVMTFCGLSFQSLHLLSPKSIEEKGHRGDRI